MPMVWGACLEGEEVEEEEEEEEAEEEEDRFVRCYAVAAEERSGGCGGGWATRTAHSSWPGGKARCCGWM